MGEHVHPSPRAGQGPTHLVVWLSIYVLCHRLQQDGECSVSLTSVSCPSTFIEHEEGVAESPTYSWLVGSTETNWTDNRRLRGQGSLAGSDIILGAVSGPSRVADTGWHHGELLAGVGHWALRANLAAQPMQTLQSSSGSSVPCPHSSGHVKCQSQGPGVKATDLCT